MKTKQLIVGATVVLILAGLGAWHFSGHSHPGGQTGEASHDHHASHGDAPLQLQLNNGEKWATDEPLRAGMSRVHAAAHTVVVAHQENSLTQGQATAFAALARREVDLLIANCHLEPTADAMLHVVIAELLAGASELEADPSSSGGAPRVLAALQKYEEHFDHPNF